MFDRFRLGTLLFICLVVPFIGCGSSTEADSILVSPATVSFGGVGLTAQLTATATIGHGNHPSTTQDVTNLVTWTTGSANVATVSASGLVTSTGPGSIQVTASMNGFTGLISSNSTVTVTVSGGGGGGTNTDVTSLTIIPGAQSVAAPTQTSQFIAIGTTASGTTKNLTSQVAWSSSSIQIATVCTAGSPAPCTASTDGLATAMGQGNTTITALYTNVADQTVVTGTATFTVVGGVSEQITALSIIPGSLALSATGQPGQFIALGTSGSTGLKENVTNSQQLAWSSSIPSYATIATYPAANAGQAAGVSPGTTNITAQWTNPASGSNPSNVVTATASVSVTTTAAAEPLLSITVLPASLTTDNLEGNGQFLAYGTFSTAPTVMDITNGVNHNGFTSPVTWISAAPDIFPVNSYGAPGATAGLVTAEGSGNAVIYVTAPNPDGTLVYSPAVTFNCPYVPPTYSGTPPVMTNVGTCNEYTIAPGLLVTLTVYNAGLNTTNWLVTAPSATNTPDVIHCGPGSASGGSVCMATYPVGTTVTLTATQNSADPGPQGTFGGWSWNCENTAPVTAAGPNSCTVYLGAIDPITTIPSSNVSVGAVFN